MDKEYFETFANSQDLYQWQKHIEYLTISKKITSESVRNQAIESLEFLRDELGKHFLKDCQHIHHPLFAYLFERSDDSYAWLIQFANTLKQLKNIDSNYHKLLKLLRPSQKCHDEGLPFINISRSFLESGFNVNILPEVDQQKKPDIKISNVKNGDTIFIEVTRPSSDTKARNIITQNSRSLFKALHQTPPYLEFSCLQKRVLDENEVDVTINEIVSTKEMGYRNNSLVVLQNDRIDLAVASGDKIDDLKKWCGANNRVQDFSPLTLEFDDTNRISRDKIVKECEQLPADKPGILYVQMNPIYFWVADLEKAKVTFQNRLKNFPNVIGVALFSYIGANTEPVSFLDKMDYCGKRMVTPNVSRTIAFFYNDVFNINISVSTLLSLYSSFEKF
jgi:hypothetical protein